MSTPERRQVPRTAMERLACINLEPDNGGIVLNVSPDGLCFHSIAPVAKNGPLHFSLLEQTRRIAACGELTWTDEIQKVGGIRFTTLTDEAREQIQNWISQPAALPVELKPTVGSVLLKAFPTFRVRRPVADPDSGSPLDTAAAFPKIRVRIKLSGFARGLATGLLISLLCMSVFVSYTQRGEIGQSLIRLGQRLSGERFAGERMAGEHPTTEGTAKAAGNKNQRCPRRSRSPRQLPRYRVVTRFHRAHKVWQVRRVQRMPSLQRILKFRRLPRLRFAHRFQQCSRKIPSRDLWQALPSHSWRSRPSNRPELSPTQPTARSRNPPRSATLRRRRSQQPWLRWEPLHRQIQTLVPMQLLPLLSPRNLALSRRLVLPK